MYQSDVQILAKGLLLPWADCSDKSNFSEYLKSQSTDWQKLFGYIGHYWMLPIFYKALDMADVASDLPEDVHQELLYIYQLNLQRNTRLIGQLHELIAYQNQGNINPLFIKGSSFLLSPLHDLQLARMMSDIDMVVPEALLPNAVQQFHDAGYHFKGFCHKYDKHITGLYKDGMPARIDLHHQLLSSDKCLGVLSPELAFSNLNEVRSDNWHATVLQDEYRIIHQLSHNQLQDRGYINRRADIRQMYDYVLLRMCSPNLNIDIVTAHFDNIGALRMWRVYQLLAKSLFPLLPELDFKPSAKEKRICQQFIHTLYASQGRWQRLFEQSKRMTRPLRLCVPDIVYDKLMRKLGRHL